MRRLNRFLTLTHRWLGVGLCLLFTLWFVSGAVMIFVPYPRLTQEERLSRAPAVDLSAVRLSPAEAVAASGIADPARIRLSTGPAGPIYLIEPAKGPVTAVDAADGTPMPPLTREQAAATASAFAARPAAAIDGPVEHDLWVVHQRYDSRRPYWRVEMSDLTGTEIYVSARTGEVVQRTDRTQRLLNWAGSVLHWVYIVPLRKHSVLWGDVLWGLSWAGTAVAVSGIGVGLLRSSKALKIPGRAALTVFRGRHRDHHLFGLGAGLFTLTWMVSGLLAVDRGRMFPSGHPHGHEVAAFRGITPAQASARVTIEQLGRFAPFAELEVVALNGRPWMIGRRLGGDQAVVPADQPSAAVAPLFPDDQIAAAMAKVRPGIEVRSFGPIPEGDFHAHLMAVSHIWSDAGRRAMLADRDETWLQADAAEGRLTAVIGPERRLFRWLYTGLHTFDLPGLRTSDTLRRSVELSLLAAGIVISVTGVVLGLRRVRRRRPVLQGEQH